jgi:hypothetical protein
MSAIDMPEIAIPSLADRGVVGDLSLAKARDLLVGFDALPLHQLFGQAQSVRLHGHGTV